VVEERATGDFVGEVGFANHRRDIEPPITVPELGWVLARGFQGKGYATEAARAAIAWGRRHFSETGETACIIAPENLASIHVAEKLGFTLVCETSYMQLPTLIYRRPLT
jgi:RimJ/RimL family protein N-acetyltransferase